MKKMLAILLCAITLMAAYNICKKVQEKLQEKSIESNIVKETEDEILMQYVEAVEELPTLAREYGHEELYTFNDSKLLVHITYPITEIKEIDEEIEQWISNTVEEYKLEVSETDGEGELLIDFESYLSNEKVVCVKLMGEYHASYLAHPGSVVKTMQGNLATMQKIKLQDILLEDGYEQIQKMVIEKVNLEPGVVDEEMLEHWFLTKDGIRFVLERGKYLPSFEGMKEISFSYEELDSIFQLPEEPKIDPSKPVIALTFDDGPSKHTERLLDMFLKHGGKGTFFVVGNMIDGKEDVLKRMVEDGHELGGHSWNHRQLTKLDNEDVKAQIMNTRAKIYSATGVDTKIFRPPYGSYNEQTKKVSEELGMSLINWSVDTLDWKTKNADAVYNEIMAQTKNGSIVLCHDLHKTTVDAMERVIPALIEQGYQLVTVSELINFEEGQLIAGKVYN